MDDSLSPEEISVTVINVTAAFEPGGELRPFEYDPGPLGVHQVEINVERCGICHSDLSMLNNDWGMRDYPLIPGHEVIGTIAAAAIQPASVFYCIAFCCHVRADGVGHGKHI